MKTSFTIDSLIRQTEPTKLIIEQQDRQIPSSLSHEQSPIKNVCPKTENLHFCDVAGNKPHEIRGTDKILGKRKRPAVPCTSSGDVELSKSTTSSSLHRPYHPALANVQLKLETRQLWMDFFQLGTEMIVTKSGR